MFELGAALTSTRGYAAQETIDAHRRGQRLCEQLRDVAQLPRILGGLAAAYIVRADVAAAQQVSRQWLTAAVATRDPLLESGARVGAGFIAFCAGEPAAARDYLEPAIASFDADLERLTARRWASDPKVVALAWLAPTLWTLGFHEAAVRVSDQAIRRARELSHPFTMAFALYFAALLHEFRGDYATCSAHADALVAVAREYTYPFILAAGSIWRGWMRFQAGHREEGLREMREGLEAYAATGAAQKRTYWLGLIARACLEIRDPEGAKAVLTEALELTDTQGVRFYLAELHRLRGRVLLLATPGDDRGAEAEFRQAIEEAHLQQAKSWELRAAESLARLWQQQGRMDEARAMLSLIYASLPEGFDPADLRDAETLLNELTPIGE